MITPRQAFKLAFLSRCADEGLTSEQTHARVKQAIASIEKRAFLGEAIGGLASAIKPVMIGGLALPAIGGILGGKMLAESHKDPLAVDEARTNEELAEIQRLTDRARRVKQLKMQQSLIGGAR